MNKGMRIALCAIVLVAGQNQEIPIISTAHADSAPLPQPEAPPDPDALLDSMATMLRSLNAFTVHTEKNFDDVLRDGTKVQFAGGAEVTMRRPDGIYVNYGDDISAKEFWYDGKSFTMMDHVHNVYMTAPAAANIAEAVAQLQSEYDIFLPIVALLQADPAGALKEGEKSRRYLGLHDVDGIRCHHLLFRGEEVNWQLWIEDGDKPLLRKLVVTYKTRPSSPQDIVVLVDWRLNPKLKDRVFKAKVPEGAIRAQPLRAQGAGQ